MDNLRKIRAPVRAAITRNGNLLEIELAKIPLDKARIEVLCAILDEKSSEMETADHNIQEALIQDDVHEDEYTKECEEIDSFREKIITYRLKVGAIFKDKDATSVYADAMSTGSSKKKFRLPKLELQKFGGDLKDWLCFWSLFRKIHEDTEIDAEDKFQYLLQAVSPGTRARELIDSYPPTAENYPKVVESLKQRFGREDLLVEVYVRELLRLVLHNATNPKEKVQVTKLYDQLESHIRALDTLGVTSEKCAAMLYPLVESCLPEDLLRIWQRQSQTSVGGPNAAADPLKNRLTNVLEFLRSEVEGEERIRLARAGFGLNPKKEKVSKEKEFFEDLPTAAGLFNSENHSMKSQSCIFCDKKHPSQDCFSAQKMALPEKKSHVQKKKCCFSCLKVGHMSKDCKLQVRCIICGQKHYPVMCTDLPRKKEATSNSGGEGVNKVAAMANISSAPEVLLKTLMVKIQFGGNSRLARVLIDDGSHRSYILKDVAEGMNLNQIGTESMIHALFGGVNSDPVTHIQYEVPVSNLDGTYCCSIKLLDQSTICTAIPKVPRGPWFGELKQRKIWISDVGTDCKSVDILIGADAIGKIMTGQVRHLKCGLIAVETKLGWTLMGEVPKRPREERPALLVTSLLNSASCITSLWQLEAIGITDPAETSTREELERSAKEHFLSTVSVNQEGRYQVHLPWVDGHPELGTNLAIAEKRLVATTAKLRENNRLAEYSRIFEEWLSLGVIERVPEGESKCVHYLPHRAVVKEASTTTKVRPVFDASAHERNSPSLNDCLEKGPNLIEEILPLLIRFREKRIGVVADIAKAFLQISVAEQDRNFLRFLWWEDENAKKMVALRHRRVVFGVSSSPFLLGAVIEFHLNRAPAHLEETARILRKSFYVDNCVSCVDTKEQLDSLISESQELFALGKFDLRGWEYTLYSSTKPEETPVLGLLWDRSEDSLRCDLNKLQHLKGPVTKRKVLSIAQQIFDPVGFLSPVTLQPKKLLQLTWEMKVGWDTELPTEISEPFLKWTSELHMLSVVRIPRWMTEIPSNRMSWSLHTFSDASKTAFAACVFLRAETSRGIITQLVVAKSRVAPIRVVTIPRLELLSCVVGVRLAAVVRKSLNLQSIPSYHWSDSTTALCWIQRDDQWATFVGNRVKEIRASTHPEQWRHVPGVSNPADLPSRGCTVRQLIESRWWEGPCWLRLPSSEWPSSSETVTEEEVSRERKKTVSSLLISSAGWSSLSNYLKDISIYTKLVRRVAWYCRFVSWLRDKTRIGKLTVEELEAGERKLLKAVQIDAFKPNPITHTKGAAIVQDEDELYRVKSRLLLSDEPKDFKLPILLPAGHPVTAMIIEECHIKNSHAGVQVMLSTLRERFWIIRARRSIRQVLRRCVRCRRYEAENLVSAPAPLPKDRVRTASVFEVVGVDLAGPLYLRGKEKAWVVIFTCAVYRAVHFELTSSLSTERFILSLRRFIGRRGRPSIIYSDNGTNFVGTENLFRNVDWNCIETYSLSKRIQWRFNPPTAAWWGGWWERVVRMLKNHLRRVLGKASLDFEEMVTILADVEAVINSRPLTYVSEDMEDLVPITPAMFLQDVRQDGVPDMDAVDALSINRRWQYRQKLREDLRKRFRSEYLSQLVLRGHTPKCSREVKVGEIVLIGSDNQKRLDWPLGKILEVIPGKDGHSRVVRVKTAVGEYLRPIQRIFPLEISSLEDVNIEEQTAFVPTVEVAANCEKSEVIEPVKLLTTKSGRVIKAPVKYIATNVSLFTHVI